MIHSTAIIHPDAEVDSSVEVGPYAIIDGDVLVGANCVLGPQVHLTGHTVIGDRNRFHTGCVIGDGPQDFKYDGAPTRLRIGEGNTFREHVTVHRSNKVGDDTVIGSGNYLMAHSHVGHNCVLHDNIIMANGALLGGHVEVFDQVFISGNCLVHQFVRIGQLALMQGGSAISQDLPPFCIARGDNGICGLNVIGLRRAGMSAEERKELKSLYHHLFRSGEKLTRAVDLAQSRYTSVAAQTMLGFVVGSKRGVCRQRGTASD